MRRGGPATVVSWSYGSAGVFIGFEDFLNGGELNPQQRAAGETALIGMGTQVENLEKSLQFCRG
jgi:hypothetical protein